MRKSVGLAIALVGALALGAPAFAAAQHSQKIHHATAHSTVSGVIESYDAATHVLHVKAPKGDEQFSTAEAKVWVASKSVEVGQLGSEVGSHASVTYSMKDGQRVATAIHVTPATKTAKR